MIANHLNSLCQQSRLYYYEILNGQELDGIPTDIQAHVRNCSYCQEQMERLEKELQNPQEFSSQEVARLDTLMEGLRLHFSYLDQEVNCQTVKPFLPSLALAAVNFKVPTPLTDHIDKCPACREHLETLCRLQLTPSQLYRLTVLLTSQPEQGTALCSSFRSDILSFANQFNFETTSPEALRHLCLCPDCRHLVYQIREEQHKSLPEKPTASDVFCDTISPADVFDYVVPSIIDPSGDDSTRSSYLDSSHLRSCPVCLGKVLDLQKNIFQILDRRETGIVTIYSLDAVEEKTNAEPIEEMESDLYQAVDKKHQFRWLWKPMAAAAAILIIGLGFFFTTPSARAIDLTQMCQALEKATCVHLASYLVDKSQPYHETWVSRPHQLRLLLYRKSVVLWDFQNRVKKVKNLPNGKITITPVEEKVAITALKYLEASFGIVPYKEGSQLPFNPKWQNIAIDEVKENNLPDTEVYDMTWLEGGVYRKNRYFIDIHTCLPKKTEYSDKLHAEDDYKFSTYTLLSYPTPEEVEKLVKSYFD